MEHSRRTGRALTLGIIGNLGIVLILFGAQAGLPGAWFIIALVIGMAASGWLAAKSAATGPILMGGLVVAPLVVYLIFVNAVVFREFGLGQLALILLILGGSLTGSQFAAWQIGRGNPRDANRAASHV